MGDGPKAGAKWSKYSIDDGKLVRKAEFCPNPNCGPGVFLALHSDRKSCGHCGYTEKIE
ncbi:MAG: 30S ribosomal protein S27ae [Euryarchaeota archaeon]|nr:30S ribosomal protein S27ae [Euryarchaeota archaeon]